METMKQMGRNEDKVTAGKKWQQNFCTRMAAKNKWQGTESGSRIATKWED